MWLSCIIIRANGCIKECYSKNNCHNNKICQAQLYYCQQYCSNIISNLKPRLISECIYECSYSSFGDAVSEYFHRMATCLVLCEGFELNDRNRTSKPFFKQEGQQNLSDNKPVVNYADKVCFLDYAYFIPNSKEPIVREYFANRGFKIKYSSNQNNDFYVHFAFLPHKINFEIFQPGEQIINQIQNNNALCDKRLLPQTMAAFDAKKQFPLFNSKQFILQTFSINLNEPNYDDEELLIQQMQVNSSWWILKPADKFGGSGIKVVKNITNFQQQLSQAKQSGNQYEKPHFVLQQYLMNPLLIEGKKFDLRYFVVIPNVHPFLAFYYPGFIRKSLFDFYIEESNATDDQNSKDDSFIHITNVFKQKKHENYRALKQEMVWLMDKFNQHLNINHTKLDIDNLHNQIKKIIAYTVLAGKEKFTMKSGMFQFFAFDLLVDSNLKPWLIEVNKSPSWAMSVEAYKGLKEKLFNTVLDLVLLLNKDQKQVDSILKNLDKTGIDLTGFEVLINEATGYVYPIQ